MGRVIISPQGLSKGGCVFLDTYVIAKNTRVEVTSKHPCVALSVARSIQDTRAVDGGTRARGTVPTRMNGERMVQIERSLDVCLEYERGTGVPA